MKIMMITLVLMTWVFVPLKAMEFRLYQKMGVVYPDMSDCRLGIVNSSNKLVCGNACLRIGHDCSLFCITGSGCELYSTRVSWHYPGLGGSSPKTTCYSSWGSSRDAAHNATLQSSTHVNEFLTKDNPINGFYCMIKRGFCFASHDGPHPFWLANLGTSRCVTSVRFQIRRDSNTGYPTKFEGVEVRVGEDTTGWKNNSLLGYYAGPAKYGEVVTFTTNTFITGSVVSVQTITTDELFFCDIQIFYV